MSEPRYVPTKEEIARFTTEGYLVTPCIVASALLETAREEIERCWRERTNAIEHSGERGAASKADYSRVRPELQRLHIESAVLSAFCRQPSLASLARALIGEDVDLSWNQAYAKLDGGDPRTEIPWHQDGWYAEVAGATLNCWVAVTRCTVTNGTIVRAPQPEAAALLPHTWDERLLFYRCDVDERGAVAVELEPGQAFVFGGRVPHRSGVNRTGASRVAFSISFSSPSARLRANGEIFGDRVPVVRRGRLVSELAEAAGRDDEDGRAFDAVVEELCARAPALAHQVRAQREALRVANAAGDRARSDALLGAMLAVLPVSEEVLGDLARARGRVDQLVEELARAGGDPRTTRALATRILELDPSHARAREALARIVG